MNLKLSKHLTTYNLFLFGLIVTAIGLPLSKSLMSIGQLLLGIAWLLDGKYLEKIKNFTSNKVAMILSGIFVIHVIGLIHTNDFDYAINDLKIKIPLLIIPFIVAGFNGLSRKNFITIFKIFTLAVLISSFWSIVALLGFVGEEIIDKRDLSRFISHIRFSLEICLAIFGILYFIRREVTIFNKITWSVAGIWLLAFLFILDSFTGIVVFVITSFAVLILTIYRSHFRWLKVIASICIILLSVGSIYFISDNINQYYESEEVAELPMKDYSPSGEQYYHDTLSIYSRYKENGYYIWRNVAWEELEREWDKVGTLGFKAKDAKGQNLDATIIRFITSKGQYKNAASVKELTKTEIDAIEKGVANYKYLEMNGLEKRAHNIIYEFDNYSNGGDFNGHSVVMRWVYWKTAMDIIKQNFFFGVGTGDLKQAFKSQYEENHVALEEKYRLRAHNQYLTFAVALGIFGFAYFIFFLTYPFLVNKMYQHYFYVVFFIIMTLSFLSEDTLETQAGVTFFCFFNTILLMLRKD